MLYGVDPGLVNYPNKHWKDNLGYEVVMIQIKDGGTGFLEVPVITISGGGGTGAKAQAYIGTGGKITWIKMTNVGSGYLSAPTVIVNGTQSEGSKPAIVSAKLGNGKIRSSHIISRFDRVSVAFLITTLEETESFVGNASKQEIDLKWPMDVRPVSYTHLTLPTILLV